MENEPEDAVLSVKALGSAIHKLYDAAPVAAAPNFGSINLVDKPVQKSSPEAIKEILELLYELDIGKIIEAEYTVSISHNLNDAVRKHISIRIEMYK